MKIQDARHYPEIRGPAVLALWRALGAEGAAPDTTAQTLKFLGEVAKTQIKREPPAGRPRTASGWTCRR